MIPRVQMHRDFEAHEPFSMYQNRSKTFKTYSFEQFWYNFRMTRGTNLVEEDVIRIAELLGWGYSTHDIGKMIGMPQRTVSYRMAKYELKSSYKSHVQKKKKKEPEEKE